MYQIAKGNNHLWLHTLLLRWTGALNYDIYPKASPNFTANLVFIYEIHIPLCFPNRDYYFLEFTLTLNINKNMSVLMETASQHIKLFLRIKRQEDQCLNSTFVTNPLKDLKLMIKYPKSQFPYLWKESCTISL